MKNILPMLFTSMGGLLGSVYGYLNVLAMLPALIASDLPVPAGFASTYQSRYFYVLIPAMLIFGWWTGKWRAPQIEALAGWRKWTALVLLAGIAAVLGYAASLILFVLSA
ncbi:MAG: hypothetical protein Kow002_04460 [Anaerolineales bacterium]